MNRIALTVAIACLFVASPAIAEVADKEPTIGYLWLWALGLNVVAFLLALIRPKLALIVLPVSLLLAIGGHLELTDPYVGPEIMRELGQNYVTTSYLIYAVSLVEPILIMVLSSRLRRRRS